ncbi:MAG: choice-of-anchor D domain-containing protein [Acidobacteria bacterium]|nr:choice-of-anchor D domain-containing protein [Acidobacteriota bacterium]
MAAREFLEEAATYFPWVFLKRVGLKSFFTASGIVATVLLLAVCAFAQGPASRSDFGVNIGPGGGGQGCGASWNYDTNTGGGGSSNTGPSNSSVSNCATTILTGPTTSGAVTATAQAADQAVCSYGGLTVTSSETSSADLTTGTAGVFASVANNCFWGSGSQSNLWDLLTFNIPGATASTVTNITLTLTIDGIYADPNLNSSVLSWLEVGTTRVAQNTAVNSFFWGVNAGIPVGNASGTLPSHAAGYDAENNPGFVTWDVVSYSTSGVVVNGNISLTGANPTLSFALQLGVNIAGNATLDFSKTGALSLTLPPGVTFTSASNAFLTGTTSPPPPTIISQPANPTNSTAADFTFSDTQSGVSFLCSLDSAAYAACSSGVTYSSLSTARHSFGVKAEDTAGNVSTPATYIWTINTTPPPPPTITGAPANSTNSTAATFTFSDTQNGVGFLCSLDTATYASCVSGVSYSALSNGGHNFAVEATDTAGNVSTPASYTWTINSTPQQTPTITWAAPAAIPYGTPLSATQLNAIANVAGNFLYTPGLGAVLPIGMQSLSVTFTPTDTTNYTTAKATVSITVNQATPVITWATPVAITYGTPLSATQLNASSSVPGNFVYTPAAGTVLPAGSQTLSVGFTPTDTTDYTTAKGAVILSVNKAGSSTAITANTPNPSSIGQSVTVSFKVTGNGSPTGSVNVSASTGESCSGGLSSGSGSCSLTFNAPGPRALTATYSGDSNFNGSPSPSTPQSVNGPIASFSKTSVNFGNVYLGLPAVMPVTLTNAGNMAMSITAIHSSGGNDADEFHPLSNCPGTLAAGGNCLILVTLLADSDTLLPTAMLSVSDNAAGSPQTVALSATVINPRATLSIYRLSFGKQMVGVTSAGQTVTLTNTGTTPLDLSTMMVTGDFALASGTTCTNGTSLAGGGSCVMKVTFTPTATGKRLGSVTIKDNALISPQIVLLSGAGS